jgi:transposase-like protein
MHRSSSSLLSGSDYPGTWDQFLDWFPDEHSCLDFMEQLRWPHGFVCPKCSEQSDPFRASRNRLICRICHKQSSVTAGTIFSKTRTPLRNWFAAVWYITSQKHGVSALGMQRVLGLGSYQTAWTMLHRLRRAMVRIDRDRLSGIVEVDETFVGGPDKSRGRKKDKTIKKPLENRSNSSQSVVAVAVEIIEPKGFGRIRLQRVRDTSESSLLPFVRNSIEPYSTVRTDGAWAYRSIEKHRYVREKHIQLGASTPAHVSLPGVHRVASLLKRWILGTYQGSIQPQHLDYYLDEYCFRFNRRTSRSRGLLFYRLIEQAVVTDPITYDEIIAEKR